MRYKPYRKYARGRKKKEVKGEIVTNIALGLGIAFVLSYLYLQYKYLFLVVVILVFGFLGLLAYFSANHISWKSKRLEQLRAMNPIEFEHYISRMLRIYGFKTTVTPASGDYGADIIASSKNEKIVVQCKRYSKEYKVTSPDLQKTQGAVSAYKADRAICITTSSYTNDAIKYSEMVGMDLIDGKKLIVMVRGVDDINEDKPIVWKLFNKIIGVVEGYFI